MNTLPRTDSFLDSRDFARVARSIRFIETHFREQPRLAEIAADAGLSEFHFNRLFRRWAGLTPKQYLAFVTGNAAKEVLGSQPSVLEAAYAVGLSGPGRLHDLVVSLEGMTPGELKARGRGVLIRYGYSDSPFGRALVGVTERGVCHLSFIESGKDSAALGELKAGWPGARLQHDDLEAMETATRIWSRSPDARMNALPHGPSSAPHQGRAALPVFVNGTNFQLKVWQALIELGARGTTTYADLAEAIDSATASRAVGNAVASNPVAWLIPCHRVLRRDGALGGYHWGVDRKRAMLAWSACRLNETIRNDLCHMNRVNRGLGA
jgi:AraC family transcriptional regulator of adaptative response/methylated-DNA-[protein]-cysteine methyltransferase